MRKYVFIISLVGVMAALAGCGSQATREENILRVGNGGEPESLDPHMTTGVPEHHILTALFEGLVKTDPSDLSPIPGVAESWDVSEDSLVYTFHLRKTAKWSNGDPVTAHDFIYAWRRILTPALAAEYAYMLHDVKNARAFNEGRLDDFSQVGAKALDDYTVEVTLEHPTPYFLTLHIHQTWFPVHRATIEKFGTMVARHTKWSRPENFVGNGPFILTKWEPNNVVATRKSETYWNADYVRLDGVEFYPVALEQTEERMFRAGELHLTNVVPLSKIRVYQRENPELIRLDPYLGTYYYLLNTTRPPFDDVRVRRALALSLDRESISKNIMRAGERPASFLTPPDLNGYTSSTGVGYDLEKAKGLLAEAGYPGGKGFPSIEILYNTQEAHKIIAVAIQQMWKKALGIDITIANQEWKVYLASTSNLDYDIARRGWIGDFVDPINFLELMTTGNGNNLTGWGNPEYDALIAQARKTNAGDERNRLYDQAEAILMNEVPIIPIYFYTQKFLIVPELKGVDSNVLGFVSYDRLYFEGPDS